MNGKGKASEGFSPDRVIHEPARLQIVSYLAAGGKEASFTELKEKLGLTAGNLSIQLKRLEEAGYITIYKTIRGRKPLTRVSLTRNGLHSLQKYLRELEALIGQLKKNAPLSTGTEEEEN